MGGSKHCRKKTSVAAHAITLTYGPDINGDEDHIRARLLTLSDPQKLLKRLRFAGFPCRYFIAGEYGSEKGRSHWHGLFYWLDTVPKHPPMRVQQNWDHWAVDGHPIGHTLWDDVTPPSIRYVTKYVSKTIGEDGRQARITMSKKPPLGAIYFKMMARNYVAQGLSPQTLYYGFDDVRKADGTQRQLYLTGKTSEIFLQEYLDEFRRVHGHSHYPNSVVVEEYEDYLAKGAADFAMLDEMGKRAAKQRATFTLPFHLLDHDDIELLMEPDNVFQKARNYWRQNRVEQQEQRPEFWLHENRGERPNLTSGAVPASTRYGGKAVRAKPEQPAPALGSDKLSAAKPGYYKRYPPK